MANLTERVDDRGFQPEPAPRWCIHEATQVKTKTEITLTQQQMGEACGITQGQTSRCLKAAAIEPSSDGYTLGDLVRLVQWRALETIGTTADGRRFDTEAERGRLLAAQASLAELRLGEERGDLVRASEVGPYWSDMVASMRGKLVALPSRIGALIADHQLRARIQQSADGLVCEALAEIEKDGLPQEARERYQRVTGAQGKGSS